MSPLRACVERACPEYALPGKSRCAVHHREFEAGRWDQGATGRRGTRPGWQKKRKAAFQRQHGRCGVCWELLEPGFEVHHRDGNARNDSDENLIAVHPGCHPK